MIIVTNPIKLLEKMEVNLGKINFLVPDVVIDELKRLEMIKGEKRSRNAKLALEISKKFKTVNTARYRDTDENIIEYAISNKCGVATIDRLLIKRLISEKITVFSLRNNKLSIINP